ncbi:MAG: acyl-CoA dehydrogenase family protein [Lysobacterales bacterium]
MHYSAPRDDMRFVLHRVLKVGEVYAQFGEDPPSEDLIDAVIEEGAKFCEQVLLPLNGPGDAEGCHYADGVVRTPNGFKAAYDQFVENGWSGLTAAPEFGGQGLPESVGVAVKEMIDSCNLSWGCYPLLSHGAVEALKHHGEPWQREAFLKPIVSGRWTGTMCLTEPHCGSDLGLLRTKAEPQADGSYAISGTKIFITGGEQDLSENIVHLVLARLPDAPSGTKGISMFVVPKFRVDQSGQMGERNALACGSIEHKMGIKASATCVMNFDGAQGWLIGPVNKGLNCMFTMMNTARLAVGIQGLGLIEISHQNALAYAKDRLQMRALSGPKRPDKPADPIIVHPDVRRMLLTQKAFAEAGRVLAFEGALLVDISERHPDSAARADAEARLGILTPIVKAMLTELAVESCNHGVQVLGGHGYIAEWGLEQFARDARITTIYEGTTQIQALDLLGRKILGGRGQGLAGMMQDLLDRCALAAKDDALRGDAEKLGGAIRDLAGLTQAIAGRAQANADEVGAAAVDYLFLAGYLLIGEALLRSAQVARQEAAGSALAESKTALLRFYVDRILPRAEQHRLCVQNGGQSLIDLPEALLA